MMQNWELRRTDLMTPQEWIKLRSYLEREVALARARGNWTAIQDRAICYMAVCSGLRRAEMAALKTADLFLEHERPFLVVTRGKGGKMREVLVSPILRTILRTFLKDRAEAGVTSPYLFAPQRGEGYTGDGIYRVWKSACLLAGVPPRSIHKARHLAATMLYAATKDLRFVQKQLGHSRLTTTQIYLDVMDTEADKNLRAFDRFVVQGA